MKAIRFTIMIVAILALAIPAFAQSVNFPATDQKVLPKAYAGNFVAYDDDQVCYELVNLGYIREVTSEMRGFKIDPPVSYADNYVSATLSADGRFLNWTIQGATMLGFIVKGGPNYNVFNYVGTGFTWDNGLYSPLHKKNIPAISHYNVCYRINPTQEGDGCTPGYWRNHFDRWFGLTPAADFDTTFGVDLFTPDITLGTAIWAQGGGADALARHATAALLNALGGVPNADGTVVEYPFTAAQVIAMVQDAVTVEMVDGIAVDKIEETKDVLAAANELGCPLEGTKADKGK